MATLSRRRRWRTTSSENAADARAQSLSGATIPTLPNGPANPILPSTSLDWLGSDWRALAASACRPRSACRQGPSKRQPWPNAAPNRLLLIGKDGAARSRPYRRGVGRDRRADGGFPRRLAWDLASFRHTWVDDLHLARLRKARVRARRDLRRQVAYLSDALAPTRFLWHRRHADHRCPAPSQVAGS
jgi:hypothetical protein